MNEFEQYLKDVCLQKIANALSLKENDFRSLLLSAPNASELIYGDSYHNMNKNYANLKELSIEVAIITFPYNIRFAMIDKIRKCKDLSISFEELALKTLTEKLEYNKEITNPDEFFQKVYTEFLGHALELDTLDIESIAAKNPRFNNLLSSSYDFIFRTYYENINVALRVLFGTDNFTFPLSIQNYEELEEKYNLNILLRPSTFHKALNQGYCKTYGYHYIGCYLKNQQS